MTKSFMPDDFQQTVDLRAQADRPKHRPEPKKFTNAIEEIYKSEESSQAKSGFNKINRPRPNHDLSSRIFRIITLLLALAIICFTVYFLFFNKKNDAATNSESQGWYAVTLCDGMIYYGQVLETKADPLVISSVYYDYDQDKAVKDKKPFISTGNLRLVKRGQEIQGGDGTMLVYRGNVCNILLEPLAEDSKVLKAITEYEQ